MDYGCGTGSETKPIQPGEIKDIQMLFTEKTAGLKISNDHHEFTISGKTGSHRMLGRPALFSLILEHGLQEKQAGELLKLAESKGSVSVRVRYGDAYPLTKSALGPGPDAPTIPGPYYGSEPVGYNNVNAIYPQEEQIPVPGLDSAMTDPRIYDPFLMPDQKAMQTAQEAGQQGQKEVFDVAMMSGLLKAVRQDTIVDKYLPALMKALDATGRLLFSFFWHQDDFEDRYGKAELPDLEDSLRNTFENLGDTVLFLREKDVSVHMDDNLDPNIEETARN